MFLCLCVRVYNRCVYCPLLLLLQLLLLLIALNCCCCCCCGSAASSRRQRCCCSYVFLRLHTNILLPVLYTHTHTHTYWSSRSQIALLVAEVMSTGVAGVAANVDDFCCCSSRRRRRRRRWQRRRQLKWFSVVQLPSAARGRGRELRKQFRRGQVAQQLQQRHLATELQYEPGKQL